MRLLTEMWGKQLAEISSQVIEVSVLYKQLNYKTEGKVSFQVHPETKVKNSAKIIIIWPPVDPELSGCSCSL